jgi:hypothetical protein
MSTANEPPDLSRRILTMQIIAGVLAMGAIIFMVIALIILGTGNGPPPPARPLLTSIGVGFTFVELLVFAIVPGRMVTGGRKGIAQGKSSYGFATDEVGCLAGLYQSTMIVGLALLEGVAFFLLIAYLIEGELLSLVIAGFLLALMVLQFPQRSRVESWIEKQQEKLSEEAHVNPG